MKARARLGIVAWALVLAACGGDLGGFIGEGGDPPPPVPVLSVTAEPIKALRFDWPEVAQATRFELVEDVDGDGGPFDARIVAHLSAGLISHRLDDVFLPDLLTATYRLRACNASACSASDPVAVASRSAAIGYFKSSNRTGAEDLFGFGVALSADGRVMAVGAPAENQLVSGVNPVFTGVTAERVGAVYVFERGSAGWTQTDYIKADVAQAVAQFGNSVALSGDGRVMVAGANRHGDATTTDSGAVYFYRRQVGGGWAQTGVFKAPVPASGAYMGDRVVVSNDGDWAAVSEAQAAGGGQVLVYRHTAGSGWAWSRTITGSNTEAGDEFGETLAMSADGQMIVVGAPGESGSGSGGMADNSVASAGAVYLFRRDSAGDWVESAYLKADPAVLNARFGNSVAVSANGGLVAVGGPHVTSTPGTPPYVELFESAGGAWSRGARLSPFTSDPQDLFGRAGLALSGDGSILVVGAPHDDGDGQGLGGYGGVGSTQNSGAVYVYRRDARGTWSSPNYVKASNSRAVLAFGESLALAADGRTMAGFGADASAATGIGGDSSDVSEPEAGAVYLY